MSKEIHIGTFGEHYDMLAEWFYGHGLELFRGTYEDFKIWLNFGQIIYAFDQEGIWFLFRFCGTHGDLACTASLWCRKDMRVARTFFLLLYQTTKTVFEWYNMILIDAKKPGFFEKLGFTKLTPKVPEIGNILYLTKTDFLLRGSQYKRLIRGN